jgi:hypothetical protein
LAAAFPYIPVATDGFFMRIVHAVLLLAVSAGPAFAQRVPTIVIPGRPDVPVIMNGVDVSWSVIEGDFGLDRPRDVWPTVIYRPFAVVIPYYYGPGNFPPGPRGPGYFPATGERPGYGRLEVVPPANRQLPPAAPSYRKSWSSQSAPGIITEYPPFAAPPVILNGGGRNWRGAPPGAPPGPGTGRPSNMPPGAGNGGAGNGRL